MNADIIPASCMYCLALLTIDEVTYYSFSCGKCEVEHHERIQRWRLVGKDEELENRFAGPKRTIQ